MSLTWFEKLPSTDAYRVNGHFAPYAVLARDVRFTDAELAAEYWRAREDQTYIVEGITWEDMTEGWGIGERVAHAREQAFHRFAAQPHFDQNEHT